MNACTVWIAFKVSPARPLVSAIRSCELRESLRNFRPSAMTGTITVGMAIRISPSSLRLVTPIITMEPARLMIERSAIEMPTPEIDCTSVVSVVRRESTSPVRVTSKNCGSIRTMFR